MPFFCHELAHLARRDNLGRVVVELATIALPWQPLMWLVRQKFRAACEEACDQWAVAAGVDPVDFASLLVEFVPERRPAFALGMAESPSAARQRILRLLAMQGPVHPRLGRLLGIAGWVAAVGLAITLAMLQISRGPRLTDPIKPELGAAGSAVGAPDDQAAPRRDEAELNTYISWTMPASQAGPRGDALPTFKAMPASGESPPWADTPLAEAIAKAAEALPKNTGRPAPYVIEPPDILLIDAVKLVPKAPYHIEPLDVLNITVANPLIDQPISGPFNVDPEGTINLGPPYGKVKVAGQTVDEALATIETHLKAALRDPQVAVYLSQTSGQQQIAGEHLVGPDGTVNLGSYGTVYVAGMTVAEAKDAVTALLTEYLEQPRVSLDVFSYNSKVYYIVVEGGDAGDHLLRAPITGNETVLDALALSTDGKIPNPAKCWVWVARPTPGQVLPELTLPVDLQAVLKGDTRSNWRIMPGDRIFLRPREKWGPPRCIDQRGAIVAAWRPARRQRRSRISTNPKPKTDRARIAASLDACGSRRSPAQSCAARGAPVPWRLSAAARRPARARLQVPACRSASCPGRSTPD